VPSFPLGGFNPFPVFGAQRGVVVNASYADAGYAGVAFAAVAEYPARTWDI